MMEIVILFTDDVLQHLHLADSDLGNYNFDCLLLRFKISTFHCCMLGVYSSCVALAVTSFGADGGIPKYYVMHI
jgi:hypothetical protein